MQAAIARLAHSARFKELLAGNWNLLVTTAGAEYVPTVPRLINTISVPARRGERAQRRSQLQTSGLGVRAGRYTVLEASSLDR